VIDKPRILVYDIESSPILGAVWGKYDQNLIWSIQDWYILGFSYRWLGEKKKTQSVFMPDFKLYKKDPTSDLEVVKVLRELFDEADVVVAHNGNSFDQKKSQARMIIHGLKPPSPYQQVDTKLVARRNFNFTSNKLDDLGVYLGLGKKLTTDYTLWQKCMAGDLKAWKYMRKYCDRDVELLEKVYLKMRAWDRQHPNMANLSDRPEVCPRCGKNEGFWAQGFRRTKTGKYRRYQCKVESCHAWVDSRQIEKQPKEDKPQYV
jgi:hypothetical protein